MRERVSDEFREAERVRRIIRDKIVERERKLENEAEERQMVRERNVMMTEMRERHAIGREKDREREGDNTEI